MAAEVMLLRRGAAGHVQRLFNVQGAGLAVRTDAPVVVDAVGHVGVLLHLGHDDAPADGVQRAGRDKKAIPFMHRHGVQDLGQGVIFDALRKLLFGDFVRKAVVEIRPRHAVQHIPHLGFAVLVFVFQRVVVGRVHLNGQVAAGVDELCQDRELLKFCAVRAQGFGVRGHVVRQRRAVGQIARAVRMAGQHPRFGQRFKVALDAEIGAQAAAAPQIILAARGQFQNCHTIHAFIMSAAALASAAFTASAAASLSPTAER